MIELQEIPQPIGNFILSQNDIKYIQTENGAYWHYTDVCSLLNRYKDFIVKDYGAAKTLQG